MDFFYALVDWGYVSENDYCFRFIKINKSDKEKFIDFCKESQKIGGDSGESIAIKCWIDGTIEPFEKDFSEMYVSTIQEHQQEIKKSLERIDKMGREHHYLYLKRDLVANLLKYEFDFVEGRKEE